MIAYASRVLHGREVRYCTRRRELLAVVYFVKYFRPYLYGRQVTIRTDHASLRYIKTLKDPNDQFARWIMRLEEIDYTIEVRQGLKHGNADGLSRIGCEGKGCICQGVHDLEATGEYFDDYTDHKVINIRAPQPENNETIYMLEEPTQENGTLPKRHSDEYGRERK